MIHVDTSFLIGALVPGSARDRKLREWLRAGEPVAISTVGWAEFLCGPVTPAQVRLAERVIPERVPLVEEDAVRASELFSASGRRRGSLLDCLIAATAIRLDAGLATANASDFRRLAADSLTILDD